MLSLDAGQRRRWFYPKTDIPINDCRLRQLRAEAAATLERRTEQAATLAGELGLARVAQPLAAGTFHVVHAVGGPQPQWVMRSTLDDLFIEDRSLLLEGAAWRWLGDDGALVPATRCVQFAARGAQFDFAMIERSPHPTLRDVGDAALDDEPRWLFAIGGVLARIHKRRGSGAGLIDLDNVETDAPRGVHSDWADYIFLSADQHVDACERAGLISAEDARDARALMERMRPLLAARPARLLHGDLGLHNLCVDAQRRRIVHVLDWEDALVGDPLFDLAMTLTFQPPRRHAAILAGYGLPQPNREEERLLAFYYLRIGLSKSVHRLRFGVADLPGREPAHHRIMRGLHELARFI